jgi:hypothetical protein
MKLHAPFLLAPVLLLTHPTQACVNFVGDLWTDGTASMRLTDNGQEVCWFDGRAGSDGLYRFTCIAANYAVIVGQDLVVEYSNPWGNFRFQSTYTWVGSSEIVATANEYC